MVEVVWEIGQKGRKTKTAKTVVVDGEEIQVKSITPAVVKRIAKKKDIKRFVVKDEQGNLLSEQDLKGVNRITIERYNEAK
jgi:hypothetical protein